MTPCNPRRAGAFVLLTLLTLSGCSSVQHSRSPALPCADKWVILPMENLTESPHAGQAAERLAENVLRSKGVGQVELYPASLADSMDELGATPRKYARSLAWAHDQGIHYGITGSVTEWRYKSGVDGEPAVGMTIQVIDIESGQSIWSSAGSKTGWDRDAVSGVAQKLILALLSSLSLSC